MTPSAAKSSSHEILRHYDVQINETLPEIEPREALRPKDALDWVIGVADWDEIPGDT